MSDLDFSDLSDDQLVELGIAIANEALRRQPAVAAALKEGMVAEAERIDAQLRGQEKAKQQSLKALEEQAHKAQAVQEREKLRRRTAEAVGRYLGALAVLIERPVAELTLVWKPSDFGQSGPHIEVNLGMTGEFARWHLVKYIEREQSLVTSPGVRKKALEVKAWAIETCAAIRALGVDRTIVVTGAEL